MTHGDVNDELFPVAVVGAGTMGSGIAQVAATAGHPVFLLDSNTEAIARAKSSLASILDRQVQKKRMVQAERDVIESRISFGASTDGIDRAGLVVEAIVENLDVKQGLFRDLESIVGADCLLATNTSSLSVTEIAASCRQPGRVIGIHFFNPAPVLPLVEVIPALQTSSGVADTAIRLLRTWGKVPVLAKDEPGFIVNRVARSFYSESLRILDEGFADCASIDWALKEIGGFRMGPFELMDLIGNDVNYAVTRSVYEAFYHDARYRPSTTQLRMVQSGRLGRKTGRGYYDYSGATDEPIASIDAAKGKVIVDRVVSMLMNEAADAVFWQVGSAADIDLAMTKGVNYPRGLLEWVDDVGARWVVDQILELRGRFHDDRYRPSPLLIDMAREGRRFYD